MPKINSNEYFAEANTLFCWLMTQWIPMENEKSTTHCFLWSKCPKLLKLAPVTIDARQCFSTHYTTCIDPMVLVLIVWAYEAGGQTMHFYGPVTSYGCINLRNIEIKDYKVKYFTRRTMFLGFISTGLGPIL